MPSFYWKTALIGAVFCVIATAFLIYGQNQWRKGYETASREMHEKIAENAEKMREQAHKASVIYQTQKSETEKKASVQYVQIEKIVDRPVYRDVCFDAGGVSIINAAVKD